MHIQSFNGLECASGATSFYFDMLIGIHFDLKAFNSKQSVSAWLRKFECIWQKAYWYTPKSMAHA